MRSIADFLSMNAALWTALTTASWLFVCGCASDAPTAPTRITGDAVTDGRNRASQGPARDRVVWQYRAALTAMHRGEFAEAKRIFDEALLTLGGLSAGDRNARRARGYFSSEDRKTFRGEPYERAMAYYYRGILYWMDGEPDNARACFRNGQLQDADAEQHQYASDYVLLDYLDGLASVKLGDDGSDALKRAQSVQKFGAPVSYEKDANVLLFVEFGQGPRKYATGAYQEQLRFREEPAKVRSAAVMFGAQTVVVLPYDDLFYQATTRGGRVMDHILANKAIFKSTTDTVGDAAIFSGAVLGSQQGRHSNVDEIGLGLAVFGVLNKVVAAFATPAADIRCWDNLPKFLTFASLRLPPGKHTATVEFRDAQGHALPALTKAIQVPVTETKDVIVYVSDQSSTPQSL